MKSEGRNLDVFDHCPQKMLERAMAQLEVARVDPNFWGAVKQDRINYYESEVAKWERLCKR